MNWDLIFIFFPPPSELNLDFSYSWKVRTEISGPYEELNSTSRHLAIDKSTAVEGWYLCLATNECGTAIQEFRVIIPGNEVHQVIKSVSDLFCCCCFGRSFKTKWRNLYAFFAASWSIDNRLHRSCVMLQLYLTHFFSRKTWLPDVMMFPEVLT